MLSPAGSDRKASLGFGSGFRGPWAGRLLLMRLKFDFSWNRRLALQPLFREAQLSTAFHVREAVRPCAYINDRYRRIHHPVEPGQRNSNRFTVEVPLRIVSLAFSKARRSFAVASISPRLPKFRLPRQTRPKPRLFRSSGANSAMRPAGNRCPSECRLHWPHCR